MRTTTVILAALAATIALPAAAESIAVPYEDLNLANPKGQKSLERRIQSAARKVCGVNDYRAGPRIDPPSVTACYKAAIAGASEQVAAIGDDGVLKGG